MSSVPIGLAGVGPCSCVHPGTLLGLASPRQPLDLRSCSFVVSNHSVVCPGHCHSLITGMQECKNRSHQDSGKV